MLFGKNNHVIETFATNTADYSLRVRILPRRVGSGDDFFDSHSGYSSPEIVSVDRISISDQVAWGSVLRKRLDQLLGRPGGDRMFCDVEMNDLTPLVQEDDEAVKVTEGRGGDRKEIDADDLSGMIGEKSLPRLGGRLRRSDSVFSDGRFSHLEPKKVEFGLNSWRAP